MHKHGKQRTTLPPPKAHRPPPKPAAPKPPDPLHTAAAILLDVLHRMPWCRDHRPDCPAAGGGPCTCGSGDLVAAMAHLREALDS